ncbi:MAG: FtsX-like permease family protein [Vicinamibacterales bacterium]
MRRLLPIIGFRPALMFGGVTFLVAALLALVNLTSRYALKMYVEDQLRRIPWDLAVYQKGSPGDTVTKLPPALRGVPGVLQIETLAFLRAEFPQDGEVISQVDGQRIRTPWISVLAASDLSVLPPQLSLALRDGAATPQGDAAVLALVGPEREVGRAFLDLQGKHLFTLDVLVGGTARRLFDAKVKKVLRLERDELNRSVMDQTGSVTYIPHIGLIVVMPFRPEVLSRFDSVAAGIVPNSVMHPADRDAGHVQEAQYEPEVAYLARLDRAQLISGWDVSKSLDRVADANHRVWDAAYEALKGDFQHKGKKHVLGTGEPGVLRVSASGYLPVHDPKDSEERRAFAAKFIVDSTTEVLLGRMERLARLVGVVTLLIALPLLWVAWLLAANLATLLMLNERRTLGLMRLRGIPGEALGGTLVVAIVAGGIGGGVLGVVAGSILPLAIYERGHLPLDVLTSPEQVIVTIFLLAVSVLLSYLVSRRLVRYAMTISPLEASARVAGSEQVHAGLKFGWAQGAALVTGGAVLASWISGAALRERLGFGAIGSSLRLLDFVAIPLFVYGVAALLASRQKWLGGLIGPIARLTGGSLGTTALRHIAVKPHRTLAFLLIVSLMASVSLYPTITSRSFEDKAIRGARVQLGGDWQLLYNAPDLVDVSSLQGGLQGQLAALQPAIERLTSQVAAVPGVDSVTYLVEAVLPNFYLPDYGLRGVPAYLIPRLGDYERTVYVEDQVGVNAPFHQLAGRLTVGDVLVSPPVARFKQLLPGETIRIGVTGTRTSVTSTLAGTLAYLPGIPPRTVSDRQGYVQARIDYLNHLFGENAYVVALADNPRLAELRVLIPRVIVLAKGSPGTVPADLQPRIVAASPLPPLEVHNLTEEISKVSTDMYIALALANMRIYLLGGIALALIAIIAVAAANYVEDRRTLALLRIRGASPKQLWRFMLALLISPALVGLLVGALVSLVAGYGLATYVWELREIRTVVQLLPTRLAVSPLWASVAALLLLLLILVASAFSGWVYRRTAHSSLQSA